MEWEIQEGDGTRGPFTEAALVLAIEQGLPATTQVRPVGKEKWKPVGAHGPFAEALTRQQRIAAPQGGATLAAAAKPSPAKLVSKSEFVGSGCVVQGLGLLIAGPTAWFMAGLIGPLGFVAGLVVLLAAMVAGRRMSTKWSCGACRNPVADDAVRVCPTCTAALSP